MNNETREIMRMRYRIESLEASLKNAHDLIAVMFASLILFAIILMWAIIRVYANTGVI